MALPCFTLSTVTSLCPSMSLAKFRPLKIRGYPDQNRCMDHDERLELSIVLACNTYLNSWAYCSTLVLSTCIDRVSAFCYALIDCHLTVWQSSGLQWTPMALMEGRVSKRHGIFCSDSLFHFMAVLCFIALVCWCLRCSKGRQKPPSRRTWEIEMHSVGYDSITRTIHFAAQ